MKRSKNTKFKRTVNNAPKQIDNERPMSILSDSLSDGNEGGETSYVQDQRQARKTPM